MFRFSGKLDHLLEPRAYHDPEWFAAEIQAVFRPAWNLLCLAMEVASPGDRYSGTIAGQPIVVVNDGGTLKAFSNVCGHRHSLICREGCSHGERMKCQIHGWEYDVDGHLAKIPDGKHFKVVRPGDFSLHRYRVERCGPFVFVSLAAEGPSFEEHLGTFASEFHHWFDDVRLVDTWIHEHDVNWKVPVENAVESYHVPVVHPNTFQDFRDEELHDHRLEPTYSRYGDLLPYDKKPGLVSMGFRAYTHLLIKNPTYARFTHVHLFPNMLLYVGDIFRSFTAVEPLAPKRFRYRCYGFVPRDVRFGWPGRRLQDLSMVLFLRSFRRIIGEDVALWPPVQQGIAASDHRGVLSAREERVHAFQRYVCEKLGRMPSSTLPSTTQAT